MSAPLRPLLVTGATGKQGSALITALLSQPTPTFSIYALTRNAKSKSALSLASKPNVHVIEGDFSNPGAIFAQIAKPWGLFSITNPMNASREEAQGKAMTTAAVKAGVQHIVFSATDRGRDSDADATPVPHFASKFEIEKDIERQSRKVGATYTLLRPVAFFENMSDDFLGRAFVAMWRVNGTDSRIQFVSTKDIGKVAAEAFLKHGEERYRNKAIPLAGDELSLADVERVFREETGEKLPETYGFFGKGLRWALREQLGIMFEWFKSNGFGVDVAETRKAYPFMKDYREWLNTESAWRKK